MYMYIVVLDDEIQNIQQQLRTEREINKRMVKEINDLKMQLKVQNDIDILSTRHGIECKDVGVQFSYLQPVSGTT